jgi:DNA repair protein RadD
VRAPNHEEQADTQAQIISEPETFEVESVNYARHQKQDKTPSMRVDYRIAGDGNIENVISEWVCFEHEGFARRKAIAWWAARCAADVPETVDDALRFASVIAVPKSITAVREGRFWRIVSADIEEIPDLSLLEEFEEEEMPF